MRKSSHRWVTHNIGHVYLDQLLLREDVEYGEVLGDLCTVVTVRLRSSCLSDAGPMGKLDIQCRELDTPGDAAQTLSLTHICGLDLLGDGLQYIRS